MNGDRGIEALAPGLIVLALLFYALTQAGSVLGFNFSGSKLLRGFGSLARLAIVGPFVLAGRILRDGGALYGDTRGTTTCIRGCGQEVPLHGLVSCRGCGYRSRRNAFAPCPTCGRASLYLMCPFCGVSVPRPAIWTQEQPPRRYG